LTGSSKVAVARRNFLFLQGVCSPFFARLADRLAADGHRVAKINFNGGDAAYWWPRPALAFRGDVAGLPAFLDETCARLGITDQVLFGDRRPVHRPAVEGAERRGVRTHVFEEGYFRPYWVTLERDGVNGHSLLPRDPDWFREVGGRLPDCGDGTAFASPFRIRAAHDVAYHLACAANPLLFPGYRPHAPVNAAVEYAGYVRRAARLLLRGRADDVRLAELLAGGEPYFLLPLQLNSDAQIRDHSRFDGMAGVMEFVMESFARHAPVSARLLIKNHPLDMGLADYPATVAGLARRYGLDGRVTYFETGDLVAMLRHARGTVTVNSTVGALALGLGCPTIALSDPVYNLPGLTFQGALEAFWTGPPAPDTELFRRFRNTVIHATQVNGGFYSGGGIELAVANSLRMLEPEGSPLEALL
jgi:capsular polysaccharide export protein